MKNHVYPLYDVPALSSIPDLIREKADQKPDRIIFRFRKGRERTESKTFRDVFTDVRKVASWLSQTHGRGKRYAIIGENSYDWLLAFFSILASGNVAVPIDKDLPAKEIAWMIRKAEVSAAFVSRAYEDQTREAEGLETISFRELEALQGEPRETFAFVSPAPEDPACIIFTSGTSGRSKGAMLTHGNIVSDVFHSSQFVRLPDGPTVAALPFHHAYGLFSAVMVSYSRT